MFTSWPPVDSRGYRLTATRNQSPAAYKKYHRVSWAGDTWEGLNAARHPVELTPLQEMANASTK
jgi:hypothetical protein